MTKLSVSTMKCGHRKFSHEINIILKYLIPTLFLCLSLGTIKKHVQFANGVTSFLYMSDAEMQRDGTLMIGGGGKSEINGKPVENSTFLSK